MEAKDKMHTLIGELVKSGTRRGHFDVPASPPKGCRSTSASASAARRSVTSWPSGMPASRRPMIRRWLQQGGHAKNLHWEQLCERLTEVDGYGRARCRSRRGNIQTVQFGRHATHCDHEADGGRRHTDHRCHRACRRHDGGQGLRSAERQAAQGNRMIFQFLEDGP